MPAHLQVEREVLISMGSMMIKISMYKVIEQYLSKSKHYGSVSYHCYYYGYYYLSKYSINYFTDFVMFTFEAM